MNPYTCDLGPPLLTKQQIREQIQRLEYQLANVSGDNRKATEKHLEALRAALKGA